MHDLTRGLLRGSRAGKREKKELGFSPLRALALSANLVCREDVLAAGK